MIGPQQASEPTFPIWLPQIGHILHLLDCSWPRARLSLCLTIFTGRPPQEWPKPEFRVITSQRCSMTLTAVSLQRASTIAMVRQGGARRARAMVAAYGHLEGQQRTSFPCVAERARSRAGLEPSERVTHSGQHQACDGPTTSGTGSRDSAPMHRERSRAVETLWRAVTTSDPRCAAPDDTLTIQIAASTGACDGPRPWRNRHALQRQDLSIGISPSLAVRHLLLPIERRDVRVVEEARLARGSCCPGTTRTFAVRFRTSSSR